MVKILLYTLIERTSSDCPEHAAATEDDPSRNYLATAWSGTCCITKIALTSDGV
jgi:hypothetical protein